MPPEDLCARDPSHPARIEFDEPGEVGWRFRGDACREGTPDNAAAGRCIECSTGDDRDDDSARPDDERLAATVTTRGYAGHVRPRLRR